MDREEVEDRHLFGLPSGGRRRSRKRQVGSQSSAAYGGGYSEIPEDIAESGRSARTADIGGSAG